MDCDRELARARSSLSPSQKLGDCADNSAAYEMARETCAAHSWGRGYYTKSVKAAAVERAKRRVKGERVEEGIRGLSAGERRTAEAVLVETRSFEVAMEAKDLDRRVAARRIVADDPEPEPAPVAADPWREAMKAWRQGDRTEPPPRKSDFG